jgi:ligand-binding sensor domain-containing protein
MKLQIAKLSLLTLSLLILFSCKKEDKNTLDSKWQIIDAPGINGVSYITIDAIAIDAQNNKWFGSFFLGVQKYDGNNWTSYTSSNGLADDRITDIAIDSQGNKWFCTIKGVSKYNGTNWTNYLKNSFVLSVAIDLQGNKWFGTGDSHWVGNQLIYDGGVFKYDGINWTAYYKANGLIEGSVLSIAIDKNGTKWFGTVNGISKFDGSNWTNYSTSNGLVNNYVKSILVDKNNNIWFGTKGGISKFDGQNWISYTTSNGLAHNEVCGIKQDSKGNIWVAFYDYDGISKFDGTSWKTIDFPKQNTAGDWMNFQGSRSLTIDSQDYKWIGTSYWPSILVLKE